MKIKSRNIVLKDEVIEATLKLEGGVIQSIDPYEEGDSDVKDYGDLIIAPGLIDIHNHGYAGWSFTGSSNKDDISHLRQRMLLEGVTSMLTTSSTLGIESILKSMKEENSKNMASIIGVHIEGPFLNSEQHGAAPPDTKFPLPDLEYMEEIFEEADGLLKMVTIAPEMQGSEEIISFLRDRDVKVSVGHSNVTYKELEAIKSKVDSMTHLGNAMSGIHHREIGALGFGLLHSDVWVEMIADGIHLSKPMMDLIFHTKDLECVLLISDTVPFAGFDEGTYESLNGKIIVDSDGKLLNEHGNINGSSFTLLSDLGYLNRNFNLSLPDLFKMASYNQTQFLGVDGIGQIKEGYKADLLVLDKNLELMEIFKEGKELDYKQQVKKNNPDVNEHLKDVEFLNFYSLRS
jgi:N-acetylglucosamine-6-phosphate deacetylase